MINETDQQAIRQRLREIGDRLKDPEKVARMGVLAKMQGRCREITDALSTPHSLVQGLPGLALMYGELNRVLPGEDWDQVAHMYLSRLQNEFSIDGYQSPGLFSGMCGFLFALLRLSCNGTRYQRALSQTKEIALPLINTYLNLLVMNNYFQPEDYTLPGGALGILATLLALAQEAQRVGTDDMPHALPLLLEHVSWLGRRDIAQDVLQFERWYTPSATALQESQMRWRAAGGAYRGYGMLHGLAGPVALLSLCMLKNPGLVLDHSLSVSIQTLARHIREGIRKDEEGWCWPLEDTHRTYHPFSGSAIYSWCSGTCGIAHALWLAGQALAENDLRTLALECIAGVYRRFFHHPAMIGSSLCHGIAGMMQICAHFAHDTGDTVFVDYLHKMAAYMLDMFEKDRPFGYRAFEPAFVRVDMPWLLEGPAGVALALSSLVNPGDTGWDRLLLLS